MITIKIKLVKELTDVGKMKDKTEKIENTLPKRELFGHNTLSNGKKAIMHF